jgi:hypothetical protein
VKRERSPTSATIVTAETKAIPRNAWSVCVDHRAHGCRGRLHGLIDRALEPFDLPHRVIDFVEVVQPRGLLRGVLELHLADPRQVPLCPCRHRRRGPSDVAQQKFAEPMVRAQLVLLRRLAGPHQIP